MGIRAYRKGQVLRGPKHEQESTAVSEEETQKCRQGARIFTNLGKSQNIKLQLPKELFQARVVQAIISLLISRMP